MCEVARRAGVGQATLYRNFPDRGALVAQLLDEEMDVTEQLAGEHADDPDAFFVLLRHVVEAVARFQGISELAIGATRLDADVKRVRKRLAGLIRGPLRDAKDAGRLDGEVTLDDVFLVVQMVKGAVAEADGAAAREAAARRALALVLPGLMPSAAQPGTARRRR
jgi:AcrR family transcriptional regulator